MSASHARRVRRFAKVRTMIERKECPSCGGRIVLNTMLRTSTHEAPECEWFKHFPAEETPGT